MQIKVFVAGDGRCSFEHFDGAYEVRTTFLGEGARPMGKESVELSGLQQTIVWDGTALRFPSTGGDLSSSLHVSDVKKL